MKKILVLANNDAGLYKLRKELLKHMLQLDYKVFISLPNGEYIETLKELGCTYLDTYIDRRGINPINDCKVLIKYFRIIKKIKPDIVLTYTIKPNVYGGIVCRLLKAPCLANITGLGSAIENKGFLQKVSLMLYKIALKKAKCVFFQNSDNMNFFVDRNIVRDKYKLLPGSGVNIDEFSYEEYPDTNVTIKFLFIGRIMKEKGVDELLLAAKEIKKTNPDTQFDLLGNCDDEYLSILSEYEKEGIITYHGRKEDVRPFIKECHAIILPSYHEGTANVLLESASMGRPILASNIPGCKDTFDEEISGLGFDVRDVNSLIKAIIKFIEFPYDKKRAMGIEGRRKMELVYNRQNIIEAYNSQISKVLH